MKKRGGGTRAEGMNKEGRAHMQLSQSPAHRYGAYASASAWIYAMAPSSNKRTTTPALEHCAQPRLAWDGSRGIDKRCGAQHPPPKNEGKTNKRSCSAEKADRYLHHLSINFDALRLTRGTRGAIPLSSNFEAGDIK